MAEKNMNAKISVEFEETANRQQLSSGDNLPTLFGKIKKFFTDLKPVALTGSYNDLTDTPESSTPVLNIANGNPITITDGVDAPLIELGVYGKSVQDGTPTPDAPIDIVSVGDDGAVEVAACGKNLLQINPEYSITDKGITVTSKLDDNGLWCVEVKGTSTSNYIDFRPFGGSAATKALNLPDGDYILSGIQPNSGLRLVALCRNDQNPQIDIGNGVKFTQGDNDYYYIRLDVLSEGDFNTVIYPMLRPTSITDSTYEPYKGTTVTITSGLPFCSVGDVCDELVYNADGTGKIIKRTAKKRLVADGTLHHNGEWQAGGWGINDFFTNGVEISSFVAVANYYCNYATFNTGAHYIVSTAGLIGVAQGGGKNLYFRFSAEHTTSEAVTNYLNANEVYIVYQLEAPQEIELSSDEMAEFMQLQTFDGVTNIYNDEGADLYIKYWCDNNINTLLNAKAPLIHTHTVSDIVDFPDTPDTSNLVSKSGDAMEGILIAQSNTDYAIAQVRNVTMSTEAASGGSNGQIHYQYE